MTATKAPTTPGTLAGLVCRLVGHREPVQYAGRTREGGRYVKVLGCPRCGRIMGEIAVGSRQERRAARRKGR
jgi:hypothetical protein